MTARTRYHMKNNTHMVEAEKTPEGLNALNLFKRDHPEFRGRHIREVLQYLPSKIQPLRIYELT